MKDTLQINLLNQKINKLQITLDSINNSNSLRQLKYEVVQKQDIISQINDFYNSAWLKLIIVITILGILLPLIVQYFQRKSLKDLTDFISKQMNDTFDLKIKELEIFNKIEIEESIKDLKDNLSRIEDENTNLLKELDATTFYFQGKTTFEQKRYEVAIRDFMKSTELWLSSKRPERCLVLFTNILKSLKLLDKKDSLNRIDALMKNSYLNLTFDEMVKKFEENEKLDLFNTKLTEIKIEVERIKNIA
jgi:hypothetical protein